MCTVCVCLLFFDFIFVGLGKLKTGNVEKKKNWVLFLVHQILREY
jgi:hypothetical protein